MFSGAGLSCAPMSSLELRATLPTEAPPVSRPRARELGSRQSAFGGGRGPFGIPLATVLVAAAIVALSFNSGTFAVTSRNPVAIGLMWAVVLGVGTLAWPVARPPRAALLAAGLLGALAVLTALSMLWAENDEAAFDEFNRVTLYAAVFAVVVLTSRRGSARRWLDGVALGLAAIGLLAVAVRLFPHLIGSANQNPFFPGDPRPSYPLGYWNGLAVLLAVGIAPLLRVATEARPALLRGLAVAVLPAFAAIFDLTLSRGGTVAAATACVLFVFLTGRRTRALAALAAAGAGSVAVFAILSARPVLKKGPVDSALAFSQGRSAALLIAVACVASGAAYLLLERFVPERGPRLTKGSKRALVVAAVAAAALLAVASHPAARWDSFKQPPGAADSALGSTEGNGRYQLWRAALDQFEANPLVGDGAGSFAAYWSQHASIDYFARDAHSLYLESLSELGPAGLLLTVGLLVTAGVATRRRLARADGPHRAAVAAAAAGFGGFAVAASIDWMWETTVVAMVAIGLLAVLTGPAMLATGSGRPEPSVDPRTRFTFERFSVLAVGIALMAAQAVPYVVATWVGDSKQAAARGDLASAAAHADDAASLQPWASSARVQLALVHEQQGRLRDAASDIGLAIRNNHSDWRTWLIDARIHSELGYDDKAREYLAKARSLNPRSPVFDNPSALLAGPG
jgi:O-antigen ligase